MRLGLAETAAAMGRMRASWFRPARKLYYVNLRLLLTIVRVAGALSRDDVVIKTSSVMSNFRD
jgi:hypothetical protein